MARDCRAVLNSIVIVGPDLEFLYANRVALELIICDNFEQMQSISYHRCIRPGQIDAYVERRDKYFC